MRRVAFLALSTLPAFASCDFRDRPANGGISLPRSIEAARLLARLGQENSAQGTVNDALSEAGNPTEREAFALARFFTDVGNPAAARRWEKYGFSHGTENTPLDDLARLESFGVIQVPEDLIETAEKRLPHLPAPEILSLARGFFLQGDPRKALRVCREAAERRSDPEKSPLLEKAAEYALAGHNLAGLEKVLAEGRVRLDASMRTLLKQLMREGSLSWKTDLLDSPGKWIFSQGGVAETAKVGKTGFLKKGEGISLWIRGLHSWVLLSRKLAPPTESFTLAARLKVNAVPFAGIFTIILSSDKLPKRPFEKDHAHALRKFTREASACRTAFELAAHYCRTFKLVRPGEDFPGYAGTGKVSTATTRTVTSLVRCGPYHSRIEEGKSPRALQFENLKEYSFRLSYWAPFHELFLEFSEIRGKARWAWTRKDFRLARGEPLWVTLSLITQGRGSTGDNPLEYVASIELIRFQLLGALEGAAE